MSNRAERRRKERENEKMQKMQNKTYTFNEMYQIVHQSELDLKKKYDAMYATCLAVTLNAEPINFGRVRVCRAVKLFMEQIDAIQKGCLEKDDITNAAEKLGVVIRLYDDKFEVYLDDGTKKKEEHNA